MNLKTTLIAVCSAFVISGCVKNINELQTTASKETISLAKERLKNIREIKITENGVIYFRVYIPNNQYWVRHKIEEYSTQIACGQLRWFVDHGMTVRVAFQGTKGITNDYNQERCQVIMPVNHPSDTKPS
ncbi:hypothetical protein [Vibrio quintilis]|uniref:Lipoprotein n=1 Tax=Vibrio quintilis TaxID=1117707 RepID=A0A1M7YXS2_9VIBR|nr:hypothetical protein [Vibrio quintilis]SHO57441.1 hypothetical protein VQ7734_03210 [Vibrio quintilis]